MLFDDVTVGIQIQYSADIGDYWRQMAKIVERQLDPKGVALRLMMGGEVSSGVAPAEVSAKGIFFHPFQSLDVAPAHEVAIDLPGIGRTIAQVQLQRGVGGSGIRLLATNIPRSQADALTKGIVEASHTAEAAGEGDLGDGQLSRMQ